MKKLMAVLMVCGLALGISGVASAGIVAHYKFDNSGNLGLDSSGNTSDLAAQNTPTYVAGGHIGGSVELDGHPGGTDYFKYTAAAFPTGVPTGNSPFSVSAWLKRPNVYWNAILAWGNTSPDTAKNSFVQFGMMAGAGAYRFEAVGMGAVTLNTPNPGGSYLGNVMPNTADGNWHHFAGTWDGTTRRIYMDGMLMNQSTPIANNLRASDFQVGARANGDWWDGELDDVAVLDIGLSAADVLAIYTAGNQGIDIATALGGAPVPEPAGLGLIGMALLTLRRKRS